MPIEEEVDKATEQLTKRVSDYPHGKYVRRLGNQWRMKKLFNDSGKIINKGNVYYGRINGVFAAVFFYIGASPSIHAKTEEDLRKIYKEYERKFIDIS